MDCTLRGQLSEMDNATQAAHTGSAYPVCRAPLQSFPSSSLRDCTQSCICSEGDSPKTAREENPSSPEMTGITLQGMLHCFLLGKFPTEVLVFLSPVIRRREEREEEKTENEVFTAAQISD